MANLRTNNLSGEQGQNAYRGSVFFNDDGAGNGYDSLTVPAGSDFAYGTDDFTFEAYVWVSVLNDRIIFSQTVSGTNYIVFFITSSGQASVILGHSNQVTSTATIAVNSWNHVAVSRASGSVKVFVNGIGTSGSSITTDLNDTTRIPTIGKYTHSTQLAFKGYISNLRVVNGTAVYTSDFTPPTSELTAIPNTVLLCCQNSDDVTQEETGKTITANGSLATAGYNKTQPKVIPPYGVDAGNTFGGPIQQSTQGYMCFPTGRTEERGRGRGVISGGRNNHAMQFINIQSQGNSIIFGDSITGDGIEGFAVGSSTRGLLSGGYPSVGNVIEFITFATTSNGTDFGDMTTGRRSGAGAGNQTRGLFAGGLNSSGTSLNTIEFSTIASLGNSTDFGDVTQARDQFAGCSDTTRAIFAGGKEQASPSPEFNIIDFVTIATTGNAQDFGDISQTTTGSSASSDSTRGIIVLGRTGNPSSFINTIEFVTIQTTGNAQDFGDLTQAGYLSANMSNSTRAVIAGRGTPASNTIDFVTIQTTGNANDFGDLIGGANFVVVGTSDSHGGLS